MIELGFSMENFIIILGVLFIIGVLTTKVSSRIGVPALVLFILFGMIVGSDGLGLIYFYDVDLTNLIGMLALVIILFDGGFQTKWSIVKPVVIPSFSLATLGVIITSVVVGIAAKFLLDVSWLEGLLFGSIVGSTDAAAVFAVMKGQNVIPRLRATLEAESGSNDPMAMILTISFLEMIMSEHSSYLVLVGLFFWQMIIGLFFGWLFGRFAIFAINKINLDSSGLYPVFAVAFAFLTFGFTDLVGASGLLAVYIAGVLIGNSELTYRHSIFRFNEGFTWMAQIIMFTILGLLVFPKQLLSGEVIINGFLLSFILMVVARPIAVYLSTINMNFNHLEKLFLSWGGLKGAVPIILATFPMAAGYENSQLFFNTIFFIVFTSALIQGSSISFVAEKLGLTHGQEKKEPMHSLELISIGKANAEMIEYEASDEMWIEGKTLAQIAFPKGVLINAIIRNDELIPPSGDTMINSGDILYILVSRSKKKELTTLLEMKKFNPTSSQLSSNILRGGMETMNNSKEFKLIVTIIAKEKTDKILETLRNEDVKKSTVILSRGISDNNPKIFFDITIEPQMETILTIVEKEKAEQLFDVIMEVGELDKPRQGVVFIMNLEKIGGLELETFKD